MTTVIQILKYYLLSSSLLIGLTYATVPCPWNNGTGKLVPLISGDIWSLTTSTEEDCRDHCTNQTSFICAAVNYRQSDRVCELQTESNQTGTVETTLTEWEYFIRPLCAGIWYPWMTVKGQSIDGTYINQEISANLRDCMSLCLRRVSPNTLCSSIVISRSGDGSCELYSKAVGEDGVTSVANMDWQYFDTPLWYRESSPGISSGDDVQNRYKVGGLLRLFSDIRITIDGYLIGWQYYLTNTNNLCSQSYVSIWGVRGQENVYEHITSTLLRPENPGVHGVRFQFVQDELIEVKVNDVIGIYGCSGGPNHAVSVTIVPSGLQYNAEKRLTFSLDSFTNPTFNNDRAWRVSLRAYVAGYTRLPSPPSTSHTSVNPGQIRLVIPALNNSDSLGAVYYRIMCSTDSSFSQSYNCHDELVPAGTTEVILDGLGITTPLYASVRVVRNFKGYEYGEDEKQTTSPSCPERNKLIDSDVNIIITEHVNNTASVELTLTTNNPDNCVRFVSVYYNGTKVFTGDSLPTSLEFTVTQPPSRIYRFTMSLTLIDGHEMMYWEGEADLTSPPPTTTQSQNQGTTIPDSGASKSQLLTTTIALSVTLGIVLLAFSLGIFLVWRRVKITRREASSSTPMPTNNQSNDNAADENNHSYETLAGGGMNDHTYEKPEMSQANYQNLPTHYEDVTGSNDDQ